MPTRQKALADCTREFQSEPGVPVIKIFVAAGIIVPLILVSLNSISYIPTNLLGWFRLLVWPASILTTGMQCSYLTWACLYSFLLNIPFYLVLGCLIWLGLQPD